MKKLMAAAQEVSKKSARNLLRLLSPFVDVTASARTARSLGALPWFLETRARYRRASTENIPLGDTYPCLLDRGAQAGDARGHYFFQDLWAARKVWESRQSMHVDVGSRIDGFVAHCASFTDILYLDVRPLKTQVPSIRSMQASLLQLPFCDHSLQSLSCLHVVEHVGLGRYGDPLDPRGSLKAIAELQRTLAPGGSLYFGVPIGRERVCFNAHRVFNPQTIIESFAELKLESFAAVDDAGSFKSSPNVGDFAGADYSCGLFHFKRAQPFARVED